MKHFLFLITLLGLFTLGLSCKNQPKETTIETTDQQSELLPAPEWSKNANIYEVNIRQYTKEGTINAFSKHLDRLDSMGVDILWLMPIFPISELHRKATQNTLVEEIEDITEREKYLGSYYSVKDYTAVNPDLGTNEDFRKLVEKIHQLDMKVVLDWVANHTGWDHNWIESHPEYYTKIEKGGNPWKPEWMNQRPEYYNRLKALGMTYPFDPNETDWWDTADLNYDNAQMRKAMTDAMSYWVTEFDIDGFRCDAAWASPLDFWKENNSSLYKLKHLFMLGESEGPKYHEVGFHMTYAWEIHHAFNEVAKSRKTTKNFTKLVDDYFTRYTEEAYLMNFISNHDENSWKGSIKERMGAAGDAFAVMAFTLNGMPLIYSGQEAGLDWRLKFFEKDEIKWDNIIMEDFYKTLLTLKHDNPAIWNGSYGGNYQKISTDNDSSIFCYKRTNGKNEVLAVFNLSDQKASFKTGEVIADADYINVFTQEKVNPVGWKDQAVELEAWGYKLLSFTAQ